MLLWPGCRILAPKAGLKSAIAQKKFRTQPLAAHCSAAVSTAIQGRRAGHVVPGAAGRSWQAPSACVRPLHPRQPRLPTATDGACAAPAPRRKVSARRSGTPPRRQCTRRKKSSTRQRRRWAAPEPAQAQLGCVTAGTREICWSVWACACAGCGRARSRRSPAGSCLRPGLGPPRHPASSTGWKPSRPAGRLLSLEHCRPGTAPARPPPRLGQPPTYLL